ncbi:hypothetical protein OG229_23885 [Streptomyces platensis]|uniref:hypothetical protein n=1 Tax=Streptomyces platensis TaxID=58346 RepID=UPI002E163BA3|nr:hypothetical protein OG229_23885 [Streptomyces platensis]
MGFRSNFSRPTSAREASNNIREAKASQKRHRDRGDHTAARDLDAEIRHQESEKKRIADEHDRGIRKIWGS